MTINESGIKTIAGNEKVKAAGAKCEYTREQALEYVKCRSDFEYFCNNYIKIRTLTGSGLINFKLRSYQKKLFRSIEDNRFTIGKIPRQYGKSTLVIAYFIWKLIFTKNYCAGILANIEDTAIKLLDDFKRSYENLPFWLQKGVVVGGWNKRTVTLENGSEIISRATTETAGRSRSFNALLLDEFAMVKNSVAEEFYGSVYPTLSSSETTKLIILSTPKGRNLFFRLYTEAVKKMNDYHVVTCSWRDIPGRDDAWAEAQKRQIGERIFNQEFDTVFLGSTSTLIDPDKLNSLCENFEKPLSTKGVIEGQAIDSTETGENTHNRLSRGNVDLTYFYDTPKKNDVYIMLVDSGYGKGQDYSNTQIIKISEKPYRQVAVYKSNTIDPREYPNVILELARYYNDAYILVETNDIGVLVANYLVLDHEYENMILTRKDPKRNGQIMITGGYSSKVEFGLKFDKRSKSVGCSALKSLVESGNMILPDYDTVIELSTFVKQGDSFAAEEGTHDDHVMPLVTFGWLSTQKEFIEQFIDLSKLSELKIKYNNDEDSVDDTPIVVSDNEQEDDSEFWNKFSA